MIEKSVRMMFAVLVALLLLLPAAQGVAQAADPRPYVVLVGVDEYKDPAIKPRQHAEADAKALYDLLIDKNGFDIAPEHVKILLGKKDEARKSEPASRDNILRAVREALNSAGPDDLVLIGLVGQGAPAGDRTCYFAADSTLKNRAKDAVGAAELEREIDKAKSSRVFIMLDVNFKGYEAGDLKIPETGLNKAFQEFDGSEDGDGPPKPVVVLSANDGLHASIDLEKHGLFTTVVLEGLKGSADIEGGEADGIVTVDELLAFVVKEMPKRTPENAKRDQRPVAAGRSTHFLLTINVAALPKIKERLAKLDELAKAGKISADVAKEGKELLERMPRLETQRTLRKKYQELADGKLGVDEFLKERKVALDSLKLPREDAVSFGQKVLKVAKLARDHHVQKTTVNELVATGIKGMYRELEEKIPDETKDRLTKVKDLSEDDLVNLLADVRQQLGNREDLKGVKATDLALSMMLHSLDNHSTYFNPDEVADFERSVKQQFIGVGIHIEPSREVVRVISPIRGSPAYRVGLKAGDHIVKVTNVVDEKGNKLAQPEETATKGMKINDVVKKILGKEGTKVILTIEREEADGFETKDYELTRGRVEVETVLGAKRKDDDSWDYYLDPANKIAYVRLTQFALKSSDDFKNVMRDLQRQGVNGVILDLRFNPGGYLTGAVEICDLLIDDGVIVTVRPRVGDPESYKGKHAGSMLDFPLVVLVNGGSASASEIVSACVQDHERGLVVGERSYGKGSVQNILKINVEDSRPSEVKLTIASFHRPSGKNLNKEKNSKDTDDWGVLPDTNYTINLSPTEQRELFLHMRNNEIIPRRDAPKKEPSTFQDRQLDAALKYVKDLATAKAPSQKPGG